jgi:peroxiredoxin
MTIKVGERVPEATLLQFDGASVSQVMLSHLTAGRNVVIFGLPGAFTRTCDGLHLPSFIRTRQGFAAKGVDDVICIAVNDPFVMAAWSRTSGAEAAGVRLLSDPQGEYTRAIGMQMDAPAVGLHGRSKRHSMHVVDGVVKVLHIEPPGGQCDLSSGETLLAAI